MKAFILNFKIFSNKFNLLIKKYEFMEVSYIITSILFGVNYDAASKSERNIRDEIHNRLILNFIKEFNEDILNGIINC